MDSSRSERGRRKILAVLLVLSVVAAVMYALVVTPPVEGDSVMGLSYFAGPTADSLLHGRGLTVCTVEMGTPGNPICFHSGRMPMAATVIALGVVTVGDHFRRIAVMKALLLLVPLEFAICLACFQLPEERWRRLAILLLLAAPFTMTMFMTLVVNLQVEECYSYAFLALGLAIVLFRGFWEERRRRGSSGVEEGLAMGFAVAGLYLSKSSMIVAAGVLIAAFAMRTKSRAARAVVVGFALVATLGWGAYQQHAGGRFTLGTSMDGLNFHKGNNAIFQREYSCRGDVNLDDFDVELNGGRQFANEWSFNDYHRQAAIVFLKNHLRATLHGWLEKLNVFFVSTTRFAATPGKPANDAIHAIGAFSFRLALWAAMGASLLAVFRFRGLPRWEGAVFLAMVGAVSLPYVLGFAYTRHASVLIYPSVLLCCRMLETRRTNAV